MLLNLRFGFLSLLLAGISAWSAAPQTRPRVNASVSAAFLPARLRVADPALRARLTALLQNQPQDSTAWAVWKGDELTVSADLAVRMGAQSDTAKKFHARIRHVLEKWTGASGIEEEESAYADGYSPNDPYFSSNQQWSLNNTGATLTNLYGNPVPGTAGLDVGMTRVWDRFDGDDSLVIAVVDAGINFRHPDLQGRWYRNMAEVNGKPGIDDDNNGFVDDTAGWDFVNNDNNPQDYLGHGSECSGIIGANFDNAAGIAGMIPRVKILPVRVLDASGSGTVANVAAGIQYAVKMHVSAINFSIGGGGNSTALQAAFQAARDSGIPVIAAAGNDSVNLDANPAPPSSYGYSNVYMVAAHNNAGALSFFSDYGAKTVPIAAPGENISSTSIDDIQAFGDNFDNGLASWTNAGFTLSSSSPLQGTQSVQWTAGANDSLTTANYIDLTGKSGSVLYFLLNYSPASSRDMLIVEGLAKDSAKWVQFANINAAVPAQEVSYDTHPMDGKPFKLRFRTLATGSVTSRVLKLDAVQEFYYDTIASDNANAYSTGIAGTSFAAPHMTAYIGLLRTACKRMGVTFTRALALAAATPDASLTGKDSTGGRLDVSKGLAFYLNTLPTLNLTDSTHTSWNVGNTVQYSLAASSNPSGYAYQDMTSLSSSVFGATTGDFVWNSSGAPTGTDTVRFLAKGGSLILRRAVAFTLKPASNGISAAIAGSRPELWVGGKGFFLPPTFFQNAGHFLRVESIDADGRGHAVFSGEVATPAASGKIAYQIPGLTGLAWRVWLDGRMLPSFSH